MALPGQQFGGLSLVEQAGDPGRLPSLDALAVQQVDGAVELQQHAAEELQFAHLARLQDERLGGDAPGLVGEQPAGRQGRADGVGSTAGG